MREGHRPGKERIEGQKTRCSTGSSFTNYQTALETGERSRNGIHLSCFTRIYKYDDFKIQKGIQKFETMKNHDVL